MKRPSGWEFEQEFSIPLDEILVQVRWNVSKGYPASPPSYSCGGEPGAPSEIEDVEITIPKEEILRLEALFEAEPSDFIDNDTLMDAAYEGDPRY